MIVNSSNMLSARSEEIAKDTNIYTVTLIYDKNRQDVDEIRKFRKFVKDASFYVNTKLTEDSREGKIAFLINN